MLGPGQQGRGPGARGGGGAERWKPWALAKGDRGYSAKKSVRNASLALAELPVFQEDSGIQIFMRNYVVINKN